MGVVLVLELGLVGIEYSYCGLVLVLVIWASGGGSILLVERLLLTMGRSIY